MGRADICTHVHLSVHLKLEGLNAKLLHLYACMNRFWTRIWGLALPLIFGGCVLPSWQRIPPGIQVERDVVYTPPAWPEPVQADVYFQASRPPAPAVLLIHGGSWKSHGPRWTLDSIAKKLSKRGYVVVNATYRGLPENRYPAPLKDLQEAIRWMRLHAKTYGIDPDRIATFGYSAGGHLASLVALKDGNPQRISAVVAGGAPFDLFLYPGGDIVPAFLGGRRSVIPSVFRDASPVSHVDASSPPIFIYHADRDTLVPPEHALHMRDAYQPERRPDIHWLKGQTHVSGFLTSGATVDRAIDFLDGILTPDAPSR